MRPFALLVSLRIRPEGRDTFLTAIEDNARASLRNEPGCLRFDVVADQADDDHFLLYEIYEDAAAFAAHKATPHFERWRAAAAVCLRDDDGQVNTAGTLIYPTEVGR
jgi:(4S)-4-hydroxy-5-phosphonooxypentane-2,3-dione isomerase